MTLQEELARWLHDMRESDECMGTEFASPYPWDIAGDGAQGSAMSDADSILTIMEKYLPFEVKRAPIEGAMAAAERRKGYEPRD